MVGDQLLDEHGIGGIKVVNRRIASGRQETLERFVGGSQDCEQLRTDDIIIANQFDASQEGGIVSIILQHFDSIAHKEVGCLVMVAIRQILLTRGQQKNRHRYHREEGSFPL